MKLKRTTKINAISYIFKSENIVLFSSNMNISVDDYLKKCPKSSNIILKDNWIFNKSLVSGKNTFYLYNCGHNSIVTLEKL